MHVGCWNTQERYKDRIWIEAYLYDREQARDSIDIQIYAAYDNQELFQIKFQKDSDVSVIEWEDDY